MPKVTMTRRFYVGSRSVIDNNFLRTLGEAIEQAKTAVENGDECRYVVEVVRVVRRASTPVVIEEVRND